MNINQYLDSTYLKTSEQAGISEKETKQNVIDLINEAIENDFVLAMIRPEFVSLGREMVDIANSKTLIGTVIGFHEGNYSTFEKLAEAQKVISNGADELDYVVNYQAFRESKINLVKSEIFKGTKLALENKKTVKWIIEIAALTNEEIIVLTQLIRDVVLDSFKNDADKVFVKSSTGFFKTKEGVPNGATFEAMKLIVENAKPLPAKAAGGVRDFDSAVEMVELGVTRIGTSSAKAISEGGKSNNNY